MKIPPDKYFKKIPKGILYFILFITGMIILLLFNSFQHKEIPQGEYHYSSLFFRNYSIFVAVIFFILGFCTGYFINLNPWVTGISLIFIIPLISLAEAIVYKGSHNLIPFEFAMYFILALPAVLGAYIGKFIASKVEK